MVEPFQACFVAEPNELVLPDEQPGSKLEKRWRFSSQWLTWDEFDLDIPRFALVVTIIFPPTAPLDRTILHTNKCFYMLK